ncbi:BTAD domain-containing putative transcriptional regulator [Actinomadura viridis]|uniref:AfsR/SARP family transcriptional regulator n=1 Tax=Actinomadura viridis TaxID=58110 RepID=UPI0036A7B69A
MYDQTKERPSAATFRILGPLEITSAAGPLTLRGMIARRLVGVLLLTPGEWVGDERLVQLVWGPSGASRAALHNTVSRLRNVLRGSLGSADVLDYSAARYRLDVSPHGVDAVRFRDGLVAAAAENDPHVRMERLRDALSEWRGPVLADTSEWIRADPAVVALEKARLECACGLADVAVELGRAEQALPFVERLAGELPYDEPLQARLIGLLAECGRRAEALRTYERVRRGLAEELGVDPSPELRRLHLALLRGDARLVLPGADAGPPEPRPRGDAVPAMLPRDVADFTGRDTQTRYVRRLMGAARRREAVDVLVLTGKIGVGKTALAVHIAHECKEDFPDGQLFIDLRGAGAVPLTPEAVLGRFLRALGMRDDAIPEGLEERSELYRSRLSGRRILIVLDNAADEAQIRPLLPGDPGCTVLVTSRFRLSALEGARQFNLDVHEPDQALALFARVVGEDRVAAEPEAARTIIEMCGRLALAVRVASLRLVSQPHRKLAWLADLLSDERYRLGELAIADLAVQASLTLTYESLDAEERRLFRWLGLLAMPEFTAWTAASLIDRSIAHTERLLDRLVHAHLLEVQTHGSEGEVGYRFHNLIRCYARERAIMEETAEPIALQASPRPVRRLA